MQKGKPILVSIVGPTAVGKTRLSLALAQELNTEILSFDSRQMYRGLDIGTAKPTTEEQNLVKHHFLSFLDPSEEYNAGQFEREAGALLNRLFKEKQVIIAVGGSTLYAQALWFGFDDIPPVNPQIRRQLQAEFEAGKIEVLKKELSAADPDTWRQIDRKNPVRILRALEVLRSSGKPISSFRRGFRLRQDLWDQIVIGLDDDRQKLYDRINQRVDEMLENGLLAEVKGLLDGGVPPGAPGMATIGYQELAAYLRGEYDYAEAIRLIKRNSRRYAKRQLTWFRRFDFIDWFAPGDLERIPDWLREKMG